MTIFSHPPLWRILRRIAGYQATKSIPLLVKMWACELKLWCVQEIREVEDIEKIARTKQLED